jgi:hypothetical protein
MTRHSDSRRLSDLAEAVHNAKGATLTGMRADFDRDGHVELKVPSYGWRLVIHRSCSGPPFRVTRFDYATNEPEGHSEHDTIGCAIATAYDYVGNAREVRERYGVTL